MFDGFGQNIQSKKCPMRTLFFLIFLYPVFWALLICGCTSTKNLGSSLDCPVLSPSDTSVHITNLTVASVKEEITSDSIAFWLINYALKEVSHRYIVGGRWIDESLRHSQAALDFFNNEMKRITADWKTIEPSLYPTNRIFYYEKKSGDRFNGCTRMGIIIVTNCTIKAEMTLEMDCVVSTP